MEEGAKRWFKTGKGTVKVKGEGDKGWGMREVKGRSEGCEVKRREGRE